MGGRIVDYGAEPYKSALCGVSRPHVCNPRECLLSVGCDLKYYQRFVVIDRVEDDPLAFFDQQKSMGALG